MTIYAVLYLAGAVATLAFSAFLILDRQYEDGIVGLVALAGLATTSAIAIVGVFDNAADWEPLPTSSAVWICFALFLARHTFRFVRWRDAPHVWRGRERRRNHAATR